MASSMVHANGKRRRSWLALFGLMTLTAAAIVCWQWPTRRPNILLVTFDTTRADRLGAYGYQHGLTAAFDEFAQRGVIFEQAYAPAPITLPSHATMLTGLYPPEHGLRVNGSGKLSRSLPVLPEILQQHGYDTAAFVAAPVLDSQYGLDRGFETYDDDFSRSAGMRGEPRRDGKDVVNSALRWLQQRTNKPFFCWVHLYDAHAPYHPRADVYQQRFEASPYDAGVAWQVQQFGRLTDYLRDHHLQDRTLVVVAGDHGEGLEDHLEDEHGMLVYNSTLLVPFVFAGPQHYCRAGTRISQAVSLVDLMPTLLDALRIPVPKQVSGGSLLAGLQGRPIPPRDSYAEAEAPFVMNRWSPLQSVISGRWKYIQTTRPELYDLENDPGELTDLAGTAPEECARLRGRLETMQTAFKTAVTDKVHLSQKDLENLRALGYVGSGKTNTKRDVRPSESLPDVKDFLHHLSKFEKAKRLVIESRDPPSTAKMTEAITLLQDVVKATRDFPLADDFLGDCLAETGQKAEAEKTYRVLLSRRPDFFKARFNLGRLLSERGRFEEAAVEFREYLLENPDSATAHLELAQALTQLRELDAAVEAYREALRLTPEFTAASLQLGRLLLQLQRPREAQQCLKAAVEQDPRSKDLRSQLMMVLVQTGQHVPAIEQGKKLLELDPQSFDTRFNLGLLFFAQRQYENASAQLREAHKLRPDDPRLEPLRQQIEAALKQPKHR